MNKLKILLIITVLFTTQFVFGKSINNPNLLAQYKEMINSASQNLQKISALKGDAQNRNDKVVVNCIKPKLITAKRLFEIAKKSYGKLSVLKKGNKSSLESSNNQARKIKMSCDRIAELLKDAQSCLSISSGEVLSKTEIIEGEDKIKEEKVEEDTTPIEDDTEAPPEASGSK